MASLPNPDWTRVSTSTGYPVVYCPDHPAAWSTGYVYIHRLVAEQKLGRFLRKGEIVHHRDENRSNYSPENIEVISQSEHARHHIKGRAREIGSLGGIATRDKRRGVQ